jgi:uncharacterized lipoprotein YehR (DUF1307 family)
LDARLLNNFVQGVREKINYEDSNQGENKGIPMQILDAQENNSLAQVYRIIPFIKNNF